MPEDLKKFYRAAEAHEAATEDWVRRLRRMSLEEKGRVLSQVCRDAAAIEYARRLNGLPPPKPTPLPASTLAFLRKHARNARRK